MTFLSAAKTGQEDLHRRQRLPITGRPLPTAAPGGPKARRGAPMSRQGVPNAGEQGPNAGQGAPNAGQHASNSHQGESNARQGYPNVRQRALNPEQDRSQEDLPASNVFSSSRIDQCPSHGAGHQPYPLNDASGLPRRPGQSGLRHKEAPVRHIPARRRAFNTTFSPGKQQHAATRI
jgi:hypothetical protein